MSDQPSFWEMPEPVQPVPRNIAEMRRAYGSDDAHICGECAHWICLEYRNRYYKCDLSVMTGGPATDWRKHCLACGKFEERKEE